MFLSHPSGPPAKTSFLTLLGGGTPSPPLPLPKRLYKEKIIFFLWAGHFM